MLLLPPPIPRFASLPLAIPSLSPTHTPSTAPRHVNARAAQRTPSARARGEARRRERTLATGRPCPSDSLGVSQ